jgi:hypothetical protein
MVYDPNPLLGLLICEYPSRTTFLERRRSKSSSRPISVVPGTNATSAYIRMAPANSRLWDIGGFQIPVELTEEVRHHEVVPHTWNCTFLGPLELSARRMQAYLLGLMPQSDKGKFATFAVSKYNPGDTWNEITRTTKMSAMYGAEY